MLRGFAQLARDALERGVEAEGHVPDLAGEDEQDGAHLDAELARGKQRDHRQHDAGKKAEHRDGLQDVEHGDHEGFDPRVIGGEVAVADGEDEAEQIGDADADDGVEGVERERAGRLRDLRRGYGMAEPVAARQDDAVEGGEAERPRPSYRARRARCARVPGCARAWRDTRRPCIRSPLQRGSLDGLLDRSLRRSLRPQASMKRRVPASKSKSSA